jgi:hypothetical protein
MKKLVFFLPFLIGLSLFGQKKEGIHKGLISVQGTLAVGFDINKTTPEQRFYIYGESEYLISDHIGINGSAWGNLGSSERRFQAFGSTKKQEDVYVHSALAGPVFHAFVNQPLDLYVGVQPGFSFIHGKYITPVDGTAIDFQVSPTASVHGGIALYASFFHLFAQVRYVRTQLFSLHNQVRLNDVRVCIGLGFNFL